MVKNREFRGYLKAVCGQFGDRLRELEQSVAEMFMNVMAVQEKVADYEVGMRQAERKCADTEKMVMSGISSLTTQFYSFTNNLSR